MSGDELVGLIKDFITATDFENALVYKSADNCELALFENSDKNNFDEMCNKLVSNGFDLLNENNISENHFSTNIKSTGYKNFGLKHLIRTIIPKMQH